MKKHSLRIFSGAGDTAVVEFDPTVEEEIEVARGAFDRAIEKGYGAVTTAADGSGGIAVRSFDPSIKEIEMLRPIAGG